MELQLFAEICVRQEKNILEWSFGVVEENRLQ